MSKLNKQQIDYAFRRVSAAYQQAIAKVRAQHPVAWEAKDVIKALEAAGFVVNDKYFSPANVSLPPTPEMVANKAIVEDELAKLSKAQQAAVDSIYLSDSGSIQAAVNAFIDSLQ